MMDVLQVDTCDMLCTTIMMMYVCTLHCHNAMHRVSIQDTRHKTQESACGSATSGRVIVRSGSDISTAQSPAFVRGSNLGVMATWSRNIII